MYWFAIATGTERQSVIGFKYASYAPQTHAAEWSTTKRMPCGSLYRCHMTENAVENNTTHEYSIETDDVAKNATKTCGYVVNSTGSLHCLGAPPPHYIGW